MPSELRDSIDSKSSDDGVHMLPFGLPQISETDIVSQAAMQSSTVNKDSWRTPPMPFARQKRRRKISLVELLQQNMDEGKKPAAAAAAATPAIPTSAASSKSSEKKKPGITLLTLGEVMATPQYREVLESYLCKNLCEESFEFLQAVSGFNSMWEFTDSAVDDRKTRIRAARAIYDEFIGPNAKQLINLDAVTQDTVDRRVKEGKIGPTLFGAAAKNIYSMLDADVYRRFYQSQEYKDMLCNPNSQQAVRPNRASFALVPKQNNASELDSIARAFEQSMYVKRRRNVFASHDRAFKGNDLVDWLLHNGHAQNRPMAVAIGQRMYYGGLIRHVNLQCEFEDRSVLYTFKPVSKSHVGAMSAGELLAMKHSHSCYTLLKGVEYHRVFAILCEDPKKLFLFRTADSSNPIIWFNLTKAKCHIEELINSTASRSPNTSMDGTGAGSSMLAGLGGDKKKKKKEAATKAPSMVLVIDAGGNAVAAPAPLQKTPSSEELQKQQQQQSNTAPELLQAAAAADGDSSDSSGGGGGHKKRNSSNVVDLRVLTAAEQSLICYIHLSVNRHSSMPERTLTFRIDSFQTKDIWMRALVCIGVKVEKWDVTRKAASKNSSSSNGGVGYSLDSTSRTSLFTPPAELAGKSTTTTTT
jgi:hypothetical protein